ncbi:phosphotyrosine protein phosphatase [Candidatus Woesearchaeota archaeon]|nr:phosphotyrosine protein phosphatase [Candidatus Woesearchaeota archaeon]
MEDYPIAASGGVSQQMKNILFICNQNKNRSKAAEEIFKQRWNTKSAGLYNENQVTEQTLQWADLIIVMEEQQRKELGKRFPKMYLMKRILSLNIPDIYSYEQEELKQILEEKMEEIMELAIV